MNLLNLLTYLLTSSRVIVLPALMLPLGPIPCGFKFHIVRGGMCRLPLGSVLSTERLGRWITDACLRHGQLLHAAPHYFTNVPVAPWKGPHRQTPPDQLPIFLAKI